MKISLYTGWHLHDQNTGPLNVTDVPERGKWYISYIAGPTLRGHSQDQNKGPLGRDFPSKEADYTVAQLHRTLSGPEQVSSGQRFSFERGKWYIDYTVELPFRGHYQDQNRTSRGISSKEGTETNIWQRHFRSVDILWSRTGVLWIGGVYMRKLAPARVSYQDDFLTSYRVYVMTASFHVGFTWRYTSSW